MERRSVPVLRCFDRGNHEETTVSSNASHKVHDDTSSVERVRESWKLVSNNEHPGPGKEHREVSSIIRKFT